MSHWVVSIFSFLLKDLGTHASQMHWLTTGQFIIFLIESPRNLNMEAIVELLYLILSWSLTCFFSNRIVFQDHEASFRYLRNLKTLGSWFLIVSNSFFFWLNTSVSSFLWSYSFAIICDERHYCVYMLLCGSKKLSKCEIFLCSYFCYFVSLGPQRRFSGKQIQYGCCLLQLMGLYILLRGFIQRIVLNGVIIK